MSAGLEASEQCRPRFNNENENGVERWIVHQ